MKERMYDIAHSNPTKTPVQLGIDLIFIFYSFITTATLEQKMKSSKNFQFMLFKFMEVQIFKNSLQFTPPMEKILDQSEIVFDSLFPGEGEIP